MAIFVSYYLCVLLIGITAARLQCRFETGETCGWQNASTNDGYTWIKSSQTSETGRYLYANGKGSKRVAELLSEPQRHVASGYVCMKFRYHMPGSQSGTLRVFSKEFLTQHESELWVKSGNQGRSWKSAKVTIPASRPFEIIFKAEKSENGGDTAHSPENEIAIDDIEEENGKCKSKLADICPISMQSIGCYNDVMQERTLPVLLVNYRKAEHLIDWLNYKSSISNLLCECAKLAREQHYKYFGLQYYGECWSGNNTIPYDEYGEANECINGNYEHNHCSGHDNLCIGQAQKNYVYEIM